MRVQLGIQRPAGAMLEPGDHQPVGVGDHHPVATPPGERRVVLEIRQPRLLNCATCAARTWARTSSSPSVNISDTDFGAENVASKPITPSGRHGRPSGSPVSGWRASSNASASASAETAPVTPAGSRRRRSTHLVLRRHPRRSPPSRQRPRGRSTPTRRSSSADAQHRRSLRLGSRRNSRIDDATVCPSCGGRWQRGGALLVGEGKRGRSMEEERGRGGRGVVGRRGCDGAGSTIGASDAGCASCSTSADAAVIDPPAISSRAALGTRSSRPTGWTGRPLGHWCHATCERAHRQRSDQSAARVRPPRP